MKYFVQMPIKRECNLQCFYCFHSDFHQNKGIYENGNRFPMGFSIEQWQKWRDKFLINADEILINFHGGETFHNDNVELILNHIQTSIDSIQTYEFLSNGLENAENYTKIIVPFKDKIRRIGFTYHRSIIDHNEELKNKFIQNVLFVKNLGVSVYIKELLLVKYRESIMKNSVWWWENHNVEVKIQDFKGIKGLDNSEHEKYTVLDELIVNDEYKHDKSKFCTCMDGYKTINIFGFDELGGNVTPCFLDQVIVGNINDMTFNPNYRVDRLDGSSKRNVIGVPKKYIGTHPLLHCGK